MAKPTLDCILRRLRGSLGAAPEQPTDRQLLWRFETGRDESAFAELVGRHGPLVLGVCRRVLRHEQDAEDAFQATFLILARKAGSIRGQGSIASWLYRVAWRLAVRVRAAAVRREQLPHLKGVPAADPSSEAAWREVGPILDEELDRLPERYRAPLVLCCLEGKTHAQAAAELGWPVGSLSKRLRRGRDLLRQRLDRRGVTLAAALTVAEVAQQGARAALPRLLGPAARGAAAFVAGQTPGTAAALAGEALAAGVLRGLVAGPVKVLAAFVVLAVAIAGAVLLAHPAGKDAPEKKSPADGPVGPPAPAVQVRTDRHGDPLPAGAVARIGTMRLLAGNHQECLAYAPDGKAVACCEWGEFIRLWDTATGKEIRRFQPPTGGIDAFAFSPDGKTLVSCAWASPELRVWDVATGKELRQMEMVTKEERTVRDVTFSPDGKTLALCQDKEIFLWDTAGWKLRGQLAFDGRVQHLAFFPDNKTLLCAPEGRSVRWLDVTTGREVRRVELGKNFPLRDLAVSPDGKTLAILSLTDLYLWSAETGKEIARTGGWEGPSWGQLAFSPDGQVLACVRNSSHQDAVLFFDTATGRELRRWDDERPISKLAFSPDGKVLAQTSGGIISLRDASTGKPAIDVPRLPDSVATVAFTPDGKSLLTCGSQGGLIGFWEPLTGKPLGDLRPTPEGYSPRNVPPRSNTGFWGTVLTADTRLAAWADGKRSVHLWEPATGKVVHRISEPPIEYAPFQHSEYCFSPDGKMLAIKYKGIIRLWDTATGKLLRPLPAAPPGSFTRLGTFSPDGHILAEFFVAEENRWICFWETGTGKELRRLTWQDTSDADDLLFSPDGKVFISRHDSNNQERTSTSMRVWDVVTGRELHSFQGGLSWLTRPAISPDGKTLAGGAGRSTIALWEIATGKERARLQGGHDEMLGSLAFAPSGRLLASGSFDHTVLVWDVTGLSPDGQLPALDPSAEEVERLWTDLGSEDAARAYRALWRLVAAAPRSVPLLAERLRPVAAVEQDRLARLITELDSDRFAVRQKAKAELTVLGELAEPALRMALAGEVTAEARKQLEELLDPIDHRVLTPEPLHALRGLEVLEQIGTPEARRLLETLAKGTPAARLTEEARAALRRLSVGPRPR